MKRAAATGLISVIAILLAVYFTGYIPGTAKSAMRQGKAAAAYSMRDPSSVQFRNLTASEFKSGKYAGQPSVCGQMNAKNANGAYVGFEDFVTGLDPITTILRPQTSSTDADQEKAKKACDGAVTLNKIEKRVGKDPYWAARRESEVVEKCSQAKEYTEERIQREVFKSAWLNGCSGG